MAGEYGHSIARSESGNTNGSGNGAAYDSGHNGGNIARSDDVAGDVVSRPRIAPLRTGGMIAGIVPTNIEEVFRLAKAIATSGLAPRDMATPEKLTVAILHGLEIGIPPMMAVNKIAVVNGRPTLWGDALPALLLSKGFKVREMLYGEDEERFAQCTVIRPNGETITREFRVADAKTAGLWGKQGPWKQYPDRMLQMRARGLAARDGAADVLSGIYIAEELQDIPEPTNSLLDAAPPSNVRKSSSQAKKDGDDLAFNELRGAISGVDTLEQLGAIESEHADFINRLPRAWAQIVATEINDKRDELTTE